MIEILLLKIKISAAPLCLPYISHLNFY